jgi:hypothetical protein
VKHVVRGHGHFGVASFVHGLGRTAQVSPLLFRDSDSVTTDKDISAGSGKGPSLSVREARLKGEYADEYPGLTPGIWIPATELARKLIERAHARRREGRHTRTFDPTHFEFRGGPTGARPRGSRTRKTDCPAPLLSLIVKVP